MIATVIIIIDGLCFYVAKEKGIRRSGVEEKEEYPFQTGRGEIEENGSQSTMWITN